MEDNKVVNNKSIRVSTLLGIIFIILKLCGVINWSWLWVLAPFWIQIGIAVVICLIVLFIMLITIICTYFKY